MSKDSIQKVLKVLLIIATVYLFLLSIKLLGHSFKLFGEEFAAAMISMTSDPFVGLIIGIVATSLIQSSSTTTSIVVGLVAGQALTLETAIPIVMGANIGTTITNTLVSLGHITARNEFKRAFGASIVHDLFNVCAVIVIFPIEINFHIIARSATKLEEWFEGTGGMTMFNPLKTILDPVIHSISKVVDPLPYSNIFLLIISLVLIFFALALLVKTIRSLVLIKLELVINKYLFRNDVLGFILGIILTSIVQSSSVTTSLIVPLAGAGVISLRQIFPYTLGANIGTTVTALLAALATSHPVAVTVAFAHLSFNIFGILLFYPLKFIPIKLAEFFSKIASQSQRNLIVLVVLYIALHFIPIAFIVF